MAIIKLPRERFKFELNVKFKLEFFDRSVLKRRWGEWNNDPISKAGNLVKKIARQSIRRRKLGGKPGPAGQPPRSRQPGALPPFKQIFSIPYMLKSRVVIGMVGYSIKSHPIPGMHEHGDRINKTVRTFYTRRTKAGRFTSRGMKFKKKTVNYPKRPFMLPALKTAMTRLPELWRDSLKS